MRLTPCATADEVARLCADQVAAVLARHTDPVLILPAGRTPLALFAELARRHHEGELDLARARIFQLDELIGVAPEDERSFQYLLRKHLIEPASLAEERLALLDGCASEPAREIATHAAHLAQVTHGRGAHLAVLGIGRNGHVAFNEPGSTRAARARVTELAPTTQTLMHDTFEPGSVPTTGITLGIAELHACRAVTLLATGASKAGPLAELVTGPSGPELPVSLFRGHDEFSVLADAEARSMLAEPHAQSRD